MQCMHSLPLYSNLGYIHLVGKVKFPIPLHGSHLRTTTIRNRAICCTKYCALSGLHSFLVTSVARNKYSSTVNWSTLFETYIRRTPTDGGLPCCFQSFSATKLPIHVCEGHLSTSPISWSLSPLCLSQREFIEFQFLLNFKLLAPSWEAVHCRTLFFVDSCSQMQSTDIGCKGNLFLNKMVGSHIIFVPKLQYKSVLKQIMENMAEKL